MLQEPFILLHFTSDFILLHGSTHAN